MKLDLARKEWLILSSIFLVFTLIFVTVYVVLLAPLKEKAASIETQLANEKQLLDVLQSKKLNHSMTQTDDSALQLQRKIPVKPFEEQLILDIERAEVMSGSLMTLLEFERSAEASLAQSAPENDSEIENVKPEVVSEWNTLLHVQSPSYYELEEFLNLLETQTRITQIVALELTGHQEMVSLDQQLEDLSYTLTVRNYYAPLLAGKFEVAPVFHTPEPGFKQNPLVIGKPGVDEHKEDENQAENTQTHQSTNHVSHTVKKGETLFSISMQYYHSREGEGLIQAYNNLETATVFAGQKLTIPLNE